MSEAHGGEQRGMVHVSYPEHWPQIEKGHVPIVTQFALLMVEATLLQVVDAQSSPPSA
jgi:hypothetical protein